MKKLVFLIGLWFAINTYGGSIYADVYEFCDGCSSYISSEKAKLVVAGESAGVYTVYIANSNTRSVKSYRVTKSPSLGGGNPELGGLGNNPLGGAGLGSTSTALLIATPVDVVNYYNTYWNTVESISNYKHDIPFNFPDPTCGYVVTANSDCFVNSSRDLIGRPDVQEAIINHVRGSTGFTNLLVDVYNSFSRFARFAIKPIPVVVNFSDGSVLTLNFKGINSNNVFLYEIDWDNTLDSQGNPLSDSTDDITIINEIDPNSDRVMEELLDQIHRMNGRLDIEDNPPLFSGTYLTRFVCTTTFEDVPGSNHTTVVTTCRREYIRIGN